MKKLSQSKLKALPIPIPPLTLQRQYAKVVQASRAAAHVGESGATTTAALTASLGSELLQDGVSERGTNPA